MIEKLAPGEEEDWLAAVKFETAGAWLPAARLRVDAAQLHTASAGSLGDKMLGLLSHAVYRASDQPESLNYIAIDRLAKIDGSLAQLAKARYVFYNVDQDAAQVSLGNLLQQSPNLPAAQLLEAEFDARLGKPDAARQALAKLSSNPRATEWMRALATSIKGVLH